jgi:hypothetical protein
MRWIRGGGTAVVLRSSAVVALAVALVCGGCSGDDGASPRGTPSTTPSGSAEPAFTPAAPPTLDPAAALTQPVTTKVFQPGFSLRLPADWLPAERDASAFQAYLGDEDVEITLDHTYRKRETVDQGVARLSATSGLTAGPVEAVTVGGRRGKAFTGQFDAGVQFTDSGFHASGSGPLGVMVLPVPDGTTLTVFLLTRTDRAAAFPGLRSLTDRVFATLRWT